MTTQRRVPRFAERAQAILNDYPWPEGFTATVRDIVGAPTVFVSGSGLSAPYAAGPLDPYDLASADPARVVPAAVKQFKAIAGQPLYTAQKRRAAQSAVDALEGVAV